MKPIPDGCEGASPYLCVNGASAAIEFYKKAFGATEVYRLAEPGGRIAHAEIRIGRAVIMLADEYPELGHRSPESLGGTPVKIHLYVEDVDAVLSQAYGAGAKILKPVKDEFYGDRNGSLEDPFGHIWFIATRKENVTPEEIQMRSAQLFG
ncbi:MAG: VOC family protein [Chloracidobacterium sp.]|nr:VOC family protein [Chloracidobacterium sp.]